MQSKIPDVRLFLRIEFQSLHGKLEFAFNSSQVITLALTKNKKQANVRRNESCSVKASRLKVLFNEIIVLTVNRK